MNANSPLSSSPAQAIAGDLVVSYRHAEEPTATPHRRSSRVVQPRTRSAGIGGYTNVHRDSGIGGHIRERRDSGMGKVCLASSEPSLPRSFSFKRVMEFANTRRSSTASQD